MLEKERDVVRETYSEQKAQELFARLKKNGTWQCPTLTVLRSFAWLNDDSFTNDPRLKYVPPFVRDSWDPKNDFRFKSVKPADFVRMKKSFRENQELLGAMKRAGVGILAGTDEFEGRSAPGTPGEEKTVAYLTDQFRRFGLSPGNPDGTFVQAGAPPGDSDQGRRGFRVGQRTVTLNVPARIGSRFPIARNWKSRSMARTSCSPASGSSPPNTTGTTTRESMSAARRSSCWRTTRRFPTRTIHRSWTSRSSRARGDVLRATNYKQELTRSKGAAR